MSCERTKRAVSPQRRRPIAGVGLAAVLGLVGCSVEWQNLQAARELEVRSQPAGSVYAGWRVFQDRCAGCHGADATGTSAGPDLLPRVRTLGERAFVGRVLHRYDWGLAQAGTDAPARERLLDEVLGRRQGALSMPPWQGEPRVQAHVADLFAYLSARAQGTQGPGRPSP